MEESVAPVVDLAVGAVPMTPIIRWWLEQGGPIDCFNQSMWVPMPTGVSWTHLVQALQALLDHHDALRMRLQRPSATSDWHLEIAPRGAVQAETCLQRVVVAGLDEVAWMARLQSAMQLAGSALEPEAGR